VPTFSAKAVEALRDLLEPNGEILPLECDNGEYFAFNVTTVVPVLDRKASEIEWLAIDRLKKREGVMAEKIIHYEFHANEIEPLAIFRIPEDVTGYYVTERFFQRVEQNGLFGFDMRKVWPLPRPKKGFLP
jgi:hypothetical protein